MNREQQYEKDNSNDKEILEEVESTTQFHQIGKPTVRSFHVWRQEGVNMVCTSCESKHGVYIGVHKRMIGVDEAGNPIIQKI